MLKERQAKVETTILTTHNLKFKAYVMIQDNLKQIYQGTLVRMGIYATIEEYFNYNQRCRLALANCAGKLFHDGCHCPIKYLLLKVNLDLESYTQDF